MRTVVSLPALKKLIAAVIGFVLAGIPVAAIALWSSHYIEEKGREEVSFAAKRVFVLAEHRIGLVTEGLSNLAERKMTSCKPEHLAAMRRTAFTVTPIKEISVVRSDGETLCTDLGVPLGTRTILSEAPAALPAGFIVEVIALSDGAAADGMSEDGADLERLVRIRKLVRPGETGLAALIPPDLLLPKVAPRGGLFRTYARIATEDGTLVDQGGADNATKGDPKDHITEEIRLPEFGLVVTAWMTRDSLHREYAGVRFLIPLSGSSMLMLAFAVAVYLRHRQNPIAEIERALRANEFVPYFQPVLDIVNARLVGAEVLCRWRKPDGTVVPPANFIPLAESSGLIFEITRRLMRSVCKELGPALASRPRLKLGFNLTARHMTDPETVSDISDIFGRSSIPLRQIVVEVTERQPLGSLKAARRVIAGLQSLGVKVAIDDVGTGHGGLSYLLKLGVDIIKIDKLFVDAIGSEPYSTTIIKSLVELARSMRMGIIAEGVETFEQVAYLRDQGIRFAQGFVFAPPLPASSFLQLLDATDPRPGSADRKGEGEGAEKPRRGKVFAVA